MKTEHTSVSEKCFNSFNKSNKRALITALIFFIFLLSSRPCYALKISGLPEWLEPAVSRSINAVWEEIPDVPEVDREATLKIVASRLFTGYEVSFDFNEKKETEKKVIFKTSGKIIKPEVNLIVPELRDDVLSWFRNDIKNLNNEILNLVFNLPQEALTWSDEALRQELERLVKKSLPGWNFNMQIFISNEKTLINISFRPGTPLILAIRPSLYSRTVPAMFRSDLEAKLIPEMSPLIGIPVSWAEVHKDEIENFVRKFLEDRHSVENMRAGVNVKFKPGAVSNLDANVESEKFLFQVWVAAYAGLEERYPEAGAFFGFRPDLGIRFQPEIYAELIFELDDFNFTRRLGARFEIFNNFWAGVEVQWPENKYFLRASYIPLKIRRPYFWWRYSPELHNSEGALGYKIDEHISVELYYYDFLYNDKLGLRGLWFL